MMRQLPSGRLSAIVLLTSLLLLGAGIRFSGLARDQRFHPDEAYYADLSRRIGIWGDWQLLDIAVDKPPLFYFTGGFFYMLLGDSEFSTRLPNAFSSMILLSLLYPLTIRLTGSRSAGILALILVIFSPLEIALAVSGFADTQMLLWLILSLMLITYQQWGKSGLAFGLAMAIKPTAGWMLPMILIIGWMHTSKLTRDLVWQWIRSVVFILILITLWDISGKPIGIWKAGEENYLPKRLIAFDELWPRLKGWGAWIGYLLPHWLILIAGAVCAVVASGRTRYSASLQGKSVGTAYMPSARSIKSVLALSGFCLIYLLIHGLIPFSIYDRYLLMLVPLVAIICAWGIAALFPKRTTIGIGLLILLVSLSPAWRAGQGKTPIVSDRGVHTGIDHLAEVINHEYGGEVFYDHWLDWELRYYLTADPQVIVVWFPTPELLIEFARKEGVTRYFVAPQDKAALWIAPIEQQGFHIEKVYDDGRFMIYRLSQ